MEPDPTFLATLILAVHVGVILFNLFGLIAIPLGAWLGCSFVRIAWWRVLHVAALAIVAVQALFGRACFLTIWQGTAAGHAATAPLIARWVNRLI